MIMATGALQKERDATGFLSNSGKDIGKSIKNHANDQR